MVSALYARTENSYLSACCKPVTTNTLPWIAALMSLTPPSAALGLLASAYGHVAPGPGLAETLCEVQRMRSS